MEGKRLLEEAEGDTINMSKTQKQKEESRKRMLKSVEMLFNFFDYYYDEKSFEIDLNDVVKTLRGSEIDRDELEREKMRIGNILAYARDFVDKPKYKPARIEMDHWLIERC